MNTEEAKPQKNLDEINSDADALVWLGQLLSKSGSDGKYHAFVDEKLFPSTSALSDEKITITITRDSHFKP